MIRIFMAIIAFAVCAYLGLHKSAVLRRRAARLDELCAMTQLFAIEIRCRAAPLDELCAAAKGVFADVLRRNIAECGDIHAAWERACDDISRLEEITGEELSLLQKLGALLGRSDIAGQLGILESCGGRLSALRELADSDCRDKCKMYRSVGMLCGAAAAVLIV